MHRRGVNYVTNIDTFLVTMFSMNRMPIAKRAKKRVQILGLLVEGNRLRATSRLADCSINTVTKLLVDVGAAGQWRRSTSGKEVKAYGDQG